MLGKIGVAGVGGLLLILVGLGAIAWKFPIVAAGVAVVLVGVVLVAYGLVQNMLKAFGMAM